MKIRKVHDKGDDSSSSNDEESDRKNAWWLKLHQKIEVNENAKDSAQERERQVAEHLILRKSGGKYESQ